MLYRIVHDSARAIIYTCIVMSTIKEYDDDDDGGMAVSLRNSHKRIQEFLSNIAM